jgi:hypothetical protein
MEGSGETTPGNERSGGALAAIDAAYQHAADIIKGMPPDQHTFRLATALAERTQAIAEAAAKLRGDTVTRIRDAEALGLSHLADPERGRGE